jgi:hypothetical protein
MAIQLDVPKEVVNITNISGCKNHSLKLIDPMLGLWFELEVWDTYIIDLCYSTIYFTFWFFDSIWVYDIPTNNYKHTEPIVIIINCFWKRSLGLLIPCWVYCPNKIKMFEMYNIIDLLYSMQCSPLFSLHVLIQNTCYTIIWFSCSWYMHITCSPDWSIGEA